MVLFSCNITANRITMCTTCGSIQTSEAEQTHLQVYLHEVNHYQNDLHNNDINNYTGKDLKECITSMSKEEWGLLHHV